MRIIIKIFFSFLIIGIALSPIRVGAFPPSRGPDRWADNLNLTSEQAQTLENLHRQFRQELIQLRKKIMLKRMELRTLTSEELRGDKGDEARRQIQSQMLQARERALVYQKEALAVLTPEQQKKMPAETDLGFHCGGWFRRGGGLGMGMGRGGFLSPPLKETGTNQP
ncbi:MAG: periplasmic heavy metal sensor [Pseudomonadota bacterium]